MTSLMAEASSFMAFTQPQILLCGASPDAARRTSPIPQENITGGQRQTSAAARLEVPIPPAADSRRSPRSALMAAVRPATVALRKRLLTVLRDAGGESLSRLRSFVSARGSTTLNITLMSCRSCAGSREPGSSPAPLAYPAVPPTGDSIPPIRTTQHSTHG